MYRVFVGCHSAKNHDGAIVLDVVKGRLLRLNSTGSLIFERLQQGLALSEIIREIVEEFHISHEIASADVNQFMKSMEQAGLVTEESPEVCP
jgi:predicted RNase H-related nuclease YkuK (DUF458 family)